MAAKANLDAKQILAMLKQHYFWICCGVVTVAALAVWFVACSGLRKQTDERISAINSAFGTGEQITRVQNHPNKFSHDGTDLLIRESSQEVYEAWLAQVNHQQGVLVWPQELGADFIAQVSDKWPIERFAFPTDPKDEIYIKYRERYRNYVDYLLPKLAETAGCTWLPDRAQKTPKEPVVLWEPANQRLLLDDHFSWPDQPSQAPTTLQLLYAQETLWALTELMHIIKRTNGDAEARYQAAIKRIYSIYLSQDAVARAGQVQRIGGGGQGSSGMPGGGGVFGMPGDGDLPTGGYGPSGAPGAGSSGGSGPKASGIPGAPGGGAAGSGPLAPSQDPADYRYVDPKDFKPLTGEQIRNALKSDDPASAFLVVAKRMPIRIRVNMDQRKLNRLLAEFGNADLPVEIRQVRINRPAAPASGSRRSGGSMGGAGGSGVGMSLGADGPPGMSGGVPGMSGIPGMPDDGGSSAPGMAGGVPGMSGIPGMGGVPGMGGSGGSAAGSRLTDSSPYDVDVELWGLIYIYNPVDMDKLGIEKSGENATAESAAEEPPAGVPAAGQPPVAEPPVSQNLYLPRLYRSH
ncbi:MAG: collagen-like protein [Pirellulaceae bacterium]|nr:collagen-like protein [Pirellulaceae bacterium]